jgi:2-polyprenyl-3-methyl-5-hydroxy-6-metoxy-1,4-benzoquinol methylase
MCSIAPPAEAGTELADALVERIFSSVLAAFDIFAVSLGDRLGYYRALVENGPQTSGGLAALTGTNERYTREWLEQQAVTGILDVVRASDDPGRRTFGVRPEYVEVLTDPTSLSAVPPMARILTGAVAPFDQLVEAYKTGAGVPYEAYGIDLLEGQAGMNRPQFELGLASTWIPAMPDVEAKLRDGRPARVADIGMGAGWSSIAFAKAYPNVVVDGFDLDEASVEVARQNAEQEGVADRVTFHVRDAGDPELAGQYDLATAFECIHDMWDPVATLNAMRRLVGPGGTALVMDEGVDEKFAAPADDLHRFMYGFSFLHCLPVGMVEQPSVATGTVMRPSTFIAYAEAAGFKSVDILPIENDFFRFYRLNA